MASLSSIQCAARRYPGPLERRGARAHCFALNFLPHSFNPVSLSISFSPSTPRSYSFTASYIPFVITSTFSHNSLFVTSAPLSLSLSLSLCLSLSVNCTRSVSLSLFRYRPPSTPLFSFPFTLLPSLPPLFCSSLFQRTGAFMAKTPYSFLFTFFVCLLSYSSRPGTLHFIENCDASMYRPYHHLSHLANLELPNLPLSVWSCCAQGCGRGCYNAAREVCRFSRYTDLSDPISPLLLCLPPTHVIVPWKRRGT